MRIIVTGSIAYDYLMSFPGTFTDHLLPDHLSRISLSFLVDSMDKRRGGCAPNIAYTLALLGERPFLMGTAGQDFPEYRHWLEAAGVDPAVAAEVRSERLERGPAEHRQLGAIGIGVEADAVGGQVEQRRAQRQRDSDSVLAVHEQQRAPRDAVRVRYDVVESHLLGVGEGRP